MDRILVCATFICVSLASLACSDDAIVPENNETSKFSRLKWSYTSTPVNYKDLHLAQIALEDIDRGELLWFYAHTVEVGDIDPAEDSQSRRNDPVPALEVIYIPTDSADVQHAWGGLVTRLTQEDRDVSGKQYLEVWLNDYIPIERSPERRGELFIDVGQVSEDAVWDPQTPPLPRNGKLDYEDRNLNQGEAEIVEDLGLDSTASAGTHVDFGVIRYEERRPGAKTFSPFTPAQDPAGDDPVLDINEDAPENTIAQRIEKYRGINGTETNQRLDTEDLDGDYELNNINNYIEYRIALADSAVIDNRRDFSPANQNPRSGWRLYRIPLAQVDNSVGGIVNLSYLKHLRMWFRGIAPGDTLDLQVAGLEFVAADSSAKPVRTDSDH